MAELLLPLILLLSGAVGLYLLRQPATPPRTRGALFSIIGLSMFELLLLGCKWCAASPLPPPGFELVDFLIPGALAMSIGVFIMRSTQTRY